MHVVYCQSLSMFLERILIKGIDAAIGSLQSGSFSYFWKRGDFTLKALSHGAFGNINILQINGTILTDYKGNVVVVKRNNNLGNRKPLKISFNNNIIWLVDYQLTEVYFSAFIKYLTDFKVCPYLQRYVSLYFVDEEYVLISEKYDMEFSKFFPQLTSTYLIQFLFQFTYTVYILKMYLGMVHFDTHLRNVMVTKSKSKTNTILGGDFILPYMEYEIRIIDFGFCTLDLSVSVDEFLKRDLKIAPHNFNKKPTIPKLFTTVAGETSKLITIELQYFLLHIYQLIARQNAKHELLNVIKNFSNCMYEMDVDFTFPKLEGFILREHDVGIVTDSITHPSHLLQGLKRYCLKYGFVAEYSCPFKEIHISLPHTIISKEIESRHRKQYIQFLKNTCELKWYESSFIILKKSFGHLWTFHKAKNMMKSSENDLIIYMKNQPYNYNNAYINVFDNTIHFSRNKNISDFHSKNFYCGKFVNDNTCSVFYIAIIKDVLSIFNFKTPVRATDIKEVYSPDILIDCSHACGLRIDYEDLQSINSRKPLFYINLL